ncbi:dienelactone hydrolase family protein [Aquabacterium sp. OR-4]|uniref:carboxylesterase family protein n=1 Tax=Aquabacterium sp. OR-4 TaxID=2978127 RepID=UPI0021B22467|nr:dienelactone hydrolase family protein [Aquabacterium sp. OR-4]MDT7835923.1 dienelactone hydrolase family protein [Aquabacterium sp. OR-4]
MQRRHLLLSAPALAGGCALLEPPAPPSAHAGSQRALALAVPGLAEPVRCWLYEPAGYATQGRPWPLLVFLHGSGERGSELERVAAHGPPRHARAGRSYPWLMCSPQLDAGRRWQPDALHALLGALRQGWHIDATRVLASGLSLGGAGVWDWAAAHPQDLAAIAPVCGYADARTVCAARAVPVRAYHGDADSVVPLAAQQAPVAALQACGGQAELIVYPGVGHDSWTPAYNDPALQPWLLAQVRR